MEDALLRNISLIMYVFLLDYFFSGVAVKKSKTFLINLIICTIILFNFLSNLFLQFEYLPYINIFLSLFIIASIAKKYFLSDSEIFFWMLFLLAVNFICESVSVKLIQLVILNQLENTITHYSILFSTSLTLLIEILFFFGMRLFLSRKETLHNQINTISLLTMSSIPIISSIILFGFLMSEVNMAINRRIIDVFITMGIVIMNICVLYLYHSISFHQAYINQIYLEKKALESEIKYVEEIKKSQENLKQIRHDLRNHFLVLSGLLENEDISSAKKYLRKTMKQQETITDFYTSDPILNYILNEKLTIAEQSEIQVNTSIFISENVKIDHDIIAIIVGNLMDNAIEACTRNNGKGKDITVIIKQFKSDLFIEINNAYLVNERYTRKERQSAGIGIKSIRSLVEKNGGIYHSWTEADRYFASIVLFDVYE
ncbi:GHKL domain-containing protein [Enterococcus faecium]|nr:GHKL domain-containing protein [Enterococcus faecium]